MKNKFEGWRVVSDHQIKENYLKICEAAVKNEKVFNQFKTSHYYRTIAEHCPYELAMVYYDKMEREKSLFLKHVSLLREKEKFGSPQIINHEPYISTSTIRYLKVADDIRNIFGNTKNFSIIEIGGADGGQATVLDTVMGFREYIDIDLEWPAKLAKKYCLLNNVSNFTSCRPNHALMHLREEKYDMAISNYAFSECEEDTQDFYINEIFSRCERGYITVNGSHERKARVEKQMKNFKNFRKFASDLDKHNHPIFVWG